VSSKPPASAVVDSVILHYFLLVKQDRLLLRLLGSPLFVPRVIYDPDEGSGIKPFAMSEMTRAIDYYGRQTTDESIAVEDRESAALNADRLRLVHELHGSGTLVVVDMDDAEWGLAAALMNPRRAGEFGLRFPLHTGEAACVAIAVTRGWVMATDDTDALTALRHLSPRHPYERIRKLLIRAGRTGLITKNAANEIHAAMRAHGFWDRQTPFA